MDFMKLFVIMIRKRYIILCHWYRQEYWRTRHQKTAGGPKYYPQNCKEKIWTFYNSLRHHGMCFSPKKDSHSNVIGFMFTLRIWEEHAQFLSISMRYVGNNRVSAEPNRFCGLLNTMVTMQNRKNVVCLIFVLSILPTYWGSSLITVLFSDQSYQTPILIPNSTRAQSRWIERTIIATNQAKTMWLLKT